jgi:hypothetical protein
LCPDGQQGYRDGLLSAGSRLDGDSDGLAGIAVGDARIKRFAVFSRRFIDRQPNGDH